MMEMRSVVRRTMTLGGVLALAGTGLLVASPLAGAAQSTQTIQCGGDTYTIRTNSNNSSQNGGWSAAQVVGQPGAHGIPVSFSGTAVDTTINNQTIFSFSQTKGNGNANQNQPVTTCTQSFSGTFDEVSEGAPPPPGVSGTDDVTMTITIGVVIKQ